VKFDIGNLLKTCGENSNRVEIRQKYEAIYVKT
jgi:hypothetical protein